MSSNLQKLLSSANRPDAIRLDREHEGAISDAVTLDKLFCGNQDAIAFWKMLHKIAHFYDDLVDQDQRLSEETVHRLMWMMLVDMQENPFFVAHYHLLKPLMVNALIAYRCSVQYEREHDDKGLEIGHVLRYQIGNVMVNAIYICGGEAHVMQYAPELYKRLCDDRLGDYLDEMTNGDDHVS